MSDYEILIETRRASILAELGAQGLRVLPEQVIRLGGGGGLRSFANSQWALEYNFAAAPNGALPAAWTGGTWTISGGKAINTPGLSGTELLTNGNMETGNPPTGWSAGGGATLTGVADERTGGAGAQSLNIARNTNDTGASRSTSGGMVGWHKASAWLKNIDATNVALFMLVAGNSMSAQTNTTSWHTAACSVLIPTGAGISARLQTYGASGKQARYDDVSIQKLLTADLFATVDQGLSDINIVAPPMDTIKTGLHAGLVLCLDSAATPANYIAVYYFNNLVDVTTKIFVVQLVAGTYTTLSETSVAYGATKYISAKKIGDQLSVFYGASDFGTQVGATVTVNAALVGNTRHGLFSTDSGNTFSGVFKLGRYST